MAQHDKTKDSSPDPEGRVKQIVSHEESAIEELGNVINAGNNLAEAAHRVQANHDGIHRLRLALAEWYMVRANEFGRG